MLKAAKRAGLRAELDAGGRSIGKQIKISNQEKVPMFAVIGEKEVEGRTLSVTSRKGGDLGEFQLDDFIDVMIRAQETCLEPHELD